MGFSVLNLVAGVRPVADEAVALSEDERDYARYYGLVFAEAEHRMGSLLCGGFRIVTQSWQPKGAVRGSVFLVHGYYDHVGLYGHVIRFLLERGWAVVAFDLPGHGLSSGARASIEDFSQYQEVLRQVLRRYQAMRGPWYFLGQSTGAAIGLEYVLHEPSCVFEQVFLLAPLIRPCGWWWMRGAVGVLRPFTGGVKRYFTANSQDARFVRFVRYEDPLQPRSTPLAWLVALDRWIVEVEGASACAHSVVIVQGTADTTVNWRGNIGRLRRLLQNPRVVYVPGARHHLVNEERPLRQACFAALERFLL